MASTIDHLRGIAHVNEQRLDILAQTENAPSELRRQKRRIQDLNIQFNDAMKRVDSLQIEKRKERKNYDKYYSSIVKRLAYRATGNEVKFAAKVENEGKKYTEVLQKLHQATTARATLRNMLSEALHMRYSLEKVCARRAAAQREFDNLYSRIFGTTSPFPEVEEATRDVRSALQAYNSSRAKLKADQQVQSILEEANKTIWASIRSFENAQNALVYAVGNRATISMIERTDLLSANRGVVQVQTMVAEAQRLSPKVNNLPPVDLSRGVYGMRDTGEEVDRCREAVSAQLRAAKERCEASTQQSKVQSKALEAARKELQEQRQVIFRHLADDRAP
ncbi:hypothetical protein E0Z10_g4658 [Xylaria hypoxylon]|uniref:Uncharacterized protein n=1 Tax=Xylaria hypoxylon TaxID=37992 RepID=A0A4Z0YJT2_9PEZI|nr:hypothetical protein E0Z10_g4658 [Xylaria hypoxylon]